MMSFDQPKSEGPDDDRSRPEADEERSYIARHTQGNDGSYSGWLDQGIRGESEAERRARLKDMALKHRFMGVEELASGKEKRPKELFDVRQEMTLIARRLERAKFPRVDENGKVDPRVVDAVFRLRHGWGEKLLRHMRENTKRNPDGRMDWHLDS